MRHRNLARPVVVMLAASLLLGCAADEAVVVSASVDETGAKELSTAPTHTSEPAEVTPTVEFPITDADDTQELPDQNEVDDAIARPEDWAEETHGKSADPDFDTVFPRDEVNRIDISIGPDTWQEMLDDMTLTYGVFGARSGDTGNTRQPPERDNARGQPAPPAGDDDRVPGEPPEDGAQPPAGRPRRRPGGAPDGLAQLGSTDDANPIWVPVTIEFEGLTWTEVGMRFKGNSSLNNSWGSGIGKLPFRLDFDQFEDENPEIDDQRFYGFQKLTFASNFKDASFLHEKVAADLFREAGVPAAHTAFYEVYVDYGEGPVYFGLYTMTEVVEDTVIEEQFGDDTGNVYKPEGPGATFASGTFNEESFDKQTNEDEADYGDVLALYDALHAESRTSDPVAWRSGLETVFDVDGFLNWLAVNTVIQNWDTYGVMSHNYFLYHDPETDLLTWIPWDNNEALYGGGGMRGALSLSLDEVHAGWPLIRFLVDDDVYHGRYIAFVETFITEVFEPNAMAERYRELAAMIEPSVLAEQEGYTFLQSKSAFDRAIDQLTSHAVSRYKAASTFVAD